MYSLDSRGIGSQKAKTKRRRRRRKREEHLDGHRTAHTLKARDGALAGGVVEESHLPKKRLEPFLQREREAQVWCGGSTGVVRRLLQRLWQRLWQRAEVGAKVEVGRGRRVAEAKADVGRSGWRWGVPLQKRACVSPPPHLGPASEVSFAPVPVVTVGAVISLLDDPPVSVRRVLDQLTPVGRHGIRRSGCGDSTTPETLLGTK